MKFHARVLAVTGFQVGSLSLERIKALETNQKRLSYQSSGGA